MSFFETLAKYWPAIYISAIESGTRYIVVAGLTYLLLYVFFARWLAGRKISRKPNSFGRMSWEFVYSMRSVVVYGIVGWFTVVCIRMGWTQFYGDIHKFGWPWFLVSIVLAILIHDTHFYWTHRLMHHPKLFRWIHHTHHLSTNPSPWATYSFSVPEAFVQASIAPVIFFILPIHPLAFLTFMFWQVGFSVFGHCGYELYPHWFVRSWLGRIFNTVTHHSQHHEVNRANFSLYFNYWDLLMGTNHQRYAERFSEAVGEEVAELPAKRASVPGT